jgi:hypothetical protein
MKIPESEHLDKSGSYIFSIIDSPVYYCSRTSCAQTSSVGITKWPLARPPPPPAPRAAALVAPPPS